MKKGLEIRIYPNKEQQKLICQTFGCCRFVYNHIIILKDYIYEECRLSFTPKLKSFKEEWPWLTTVPSQAIANSYMDAMTAYKNFFKCLKGESEAKQDHPKLKRKHSKQSFRIAATKTSKGYDLRIEDNEHIKIPLIGKMRFRNYNDLDWSNIHVYNATIKMTPTGKFFAELCCEVPEKEYVKPKFNACGFDLGLKDFAILDSGEVIENPRYFRKAQKKLAKEQRKLSRCKKGSNGYEKQRIKVAKIHEKIKNQRKDFQHQMSNRIVNENQVIVSEDLNVKGMIKNRKLSKSIQDAGFGRFCGMIKYKAEQQHRTYIKIDRFFPSSKLCHCCGFKYKGLRLDERFWICPECNTYLDRDENAAVNILNEGLRILNESTVGTTGSDVPVASKPIDTGLTASLESESQQQTVENQLSLAVD